MQQKTQFCFMCTLLPMLFLILLELEKKKKHLLENRCLIFYSSHVYFRKYGVFIEI